MHLWLIKPRKEWKKPVWDTCNGFVIQAENESKARKLASTKSGDEGPDGWLNPNLSSCEEIPQDGKDKIILRDFDAA